MEFWQGSPPDVPNELLLKARDRRAWRARSGFEQGIYQQNGITLRLQ
jgi:hypothetical protein